MFPLKDDNPRHGPAFVMWVLIAINLVAFIVGLSGTRREAFEFVTTYGFVPQQFFDDPTSNAYRLVTSMFLHGGLAHILGNMFFLFVFGDNIEDRMGHVTFLGFYLVAGVLATLLHGIFSAESTRPMIGASGAVSAILGAYIVLFTRRRVLTFIPPFFVFWLPAWFYIGYWALLQFFEATRGLFMPEQAAMSAVAWWAHLGGFVVGVVAVRFLVSKDDIPRQSPLA
ncbi:MAG: rhomboid family intramembrane serine protease [Trueperaceae bacterium]|nr:rhomboid family intramembrane serine protease [Trueperaceae bacterium]